MILVLGRLMQKDHKFEVYTGYLQSLQEAKIKCKMFFPKTNFNIVTYNSYCPAHCLLAEYSVNYFQKNRGIKFNNLQINIWNSIICCWCVINPRVSFGEHFQWSPNLGRPTPEQ